MRIARQHLVNPHAEAVIQHKHLASGDEAVVGVHIHGVTGQLVELHDAAFAEARHLRLPLLADFEPKGAVSRAYGVYNEGEGTSGRALFVIDREGVIRWSYLSPDEFNPGADGILEALEGLSVPIQHGGTP